MRRHIRTHPLFSIYSSGRKPVDKILSCNYTDYNGGDTHEAN